MNLDGQNVGAVVQIGNIDFEFKKGRFFAATDNTGCEVIERHVSARHIAADNLLAIEVHNGTVIALQPNSKPLVLGFVGDMKRFSEVGCAIFIGGVRSKADNRSFTSVAVTKPRHFPIATNCH